MHLVSSLPYNAFMEEEIEQLEIKVSYLESQNAELNDVMIEQGKDITYLKIRVEHLERKVKELIEETGEARPNRKPPHY